MREHLYKARRKDNGEWIEGAYGVLGKDTDIESHVIMISTLNTCGCDYFYFEDIEVDPESISQFIQVVNKQRIFENDIVKAYKHGDLETQPFIYPIEYRNGTYWFGNWTWLEFLNVMRFVEVIGNVKDSKQ